MKYIIIPLIKIIYRILFIIFTFSIILPLYIIAWILLSLWNFKLSEWHIIVNNEAKYYFKTRGDRNILVTMKRWLKGKRFPPGIMRYYNDVEYKINELKDV